jgi:sugar lactone lactonase YvrE
MDGVIRRMDPDGSGVEVLISESIDPDSIAIDPQRGHMYWTHDDVAIMRANLDGSGVETILSDLPSPYGLALDLVADRIYWTNQIDDPAIQSANLDGSDVQGLVPDSVDCCAIGISIDVVNRKMYWMDGYYEGSVMRADLDGANVETIATTVGIATGIDVDPDGGKVYWTEYGNGSLDDVVRRANLDGSQVEALLDASDGLQTPCRIAVDPAEGKIYFSDLHTGRILRANQDGTGLETLWTGEAHTRDIALERHEPCR